MPSTVPFFPNRKSLRTQQADMKQAWLHHGSELEVQPSEQQLGLSWAAYWSNKLDTWFKRPKIYYMTMFSVQTKYGLGFYCFCVLYVKLSNPKCIYLIFFNATLEIISAVHFYLLNVNSNWVTRCRYQNYTHITTVFVLYFGFE